MKTACSTGAGRLMTSPTPRPASWRSVSSRRSAPTPRGVPRSSSPGCTTWSRMRSGPLPAPREVSWTARGLCSAAVAAAAPPPGTNPSPTPSCPTTSGASTSKAGSALATGRASIPSLCRTRPLATSSPAAGWNAPPASRSDASWSPPSASTASPRSSGLTTARPSPASAWAASHPSPHGGSSSGSSPSASSRDTPEQNGRIERLHRTLKAETASPPRANRRRQRRAFDHFRHSYNNERPHEALGQRPPVRLYTPSFRPYPSRLRKGDRVYVSASLRGEPIGLVQQDERTWPIQFGPLLIGVLDDHARRIDKTSVHVLPMSPV